ncbi:hypothetical protein QE250_09315 [Chromatiaceae bacterium AAb-1]|nr:hypothetical protein [Chromatiaceae bacterium AAb-1]
MQIGAKQIAELSKKLMSLQQHLLLAVKQQQWQQIRRLDAQLTQLLAVIEQAGLKQHFSSQLNTLQKTYQHVLTLTKTEMNRTELLMNNLAKNKQGIMAYQQITEEGQL